MQRKRELRYCIYADGKDTYWVFLAVNAEKALEEAKKVIGHFFKGKELTAVSKEVR